MVDGVIVDGTRVNGATDDGDAVEGPNVGSVDGLRDGFNDEDDDDGDDTTVSFSVGCNEVTIDSILVDIAVGSQVGRIEGSSVLE